MSCRRADADDAADLKLGLERFLDILGDSLDLAAAVTVGKFLDDDHVRLVDAYDKIREAGKLDDLEYLLEEWFDGEATMTQINDVLWYDYEQIFDALGIPTDEEE